MPPAPRLTLYVCALDEEGSKSHACRVAGEALRYAGHNFLKVVSEGKKNKRPDVLAATGQQALPALKLTDETTIIVGSQAIAGWAAENDRTSIGKPVPVPGLPSGRPKEDC